jgi:hypothetical protein
MYKYSSQCQPCSSSYGLNERALAVDITIAAPEWQEYRAMRKPPYTMLDMVENNAITTMALPRTDERSDHVNGPFVWCSTGRNTSAVTDLARLSV